MATMPHILAHVNTSIYVHNITLVFFCFLCGDWRAFPFVDRGGSRQPTAATWMCTHMTMYIRHIWNTS